MKTGYKCYLTPSEKKKIIEKARAVGLTGKGSFSHFISKVANEPVVFVDENLKTLLKATLSPTSQ